MHQRVKEILEQSGYTYTVHFHADLPQLIRSPQDFADALGYPIERIAKTLFVRDSKEERWALVVCPMNKKVNVSVIADFLLSTRVEVATVEELKEKIGYPPHGVSPIGVQPFPVFMDEALFTFETILVGAGQAGVEIEINPEDLKDLTQAKMLKVGL